MNNLELWGLLLCCSNKSPNFYPTPPFCPLPHLPSFNLMTLTLQHPKGRTISKDLILKGAHCLTITHPQTHIRTLFQLYDLHVHELGLILQAKDLWLPQNLGSTVNRHIRGLLASSPVPKGTTFILAPFLIRTEMTALKTAGNNCHFICHFPPARRVKQL